MELLLLLAWISTLISTLLFLVIFFEKLGFGRKFKGQHPRPPPGPWKLPFVGCMYQLAGQLPFRAFRDLSLKYGPLMLLRIGQVDVVVASSREAAQAILKNQDPKFAWRAELAASKILFHGSSDVIFSPYGSSWKQLRKLCFMELLGPNRIRSFASIREEETLDLMRDIASMMTTTTTTPINMSEKLNRMSTAILSRAAFGSRMEQPERFLLLAKEAMELLGGFSAADLFPSLKFLDILSGLRYRLRRIHRQVDEILSDVIKDHTAKAKANNRPRAGEVVEDLVDVLLRAKDEPDLEVPMTMDTVKNVIFDMLLGGTGTSPDVVEWAMSELMRNPRMMDKAQLEVREAMKGKTRLEESDVVDLKYIRSIVKETLRLHPLVPLIPRVCRETCEVVGHEIKAGTRVFVNAWAMNRDPRDVDDAESFRPERFQGDSNVDYKGGFNSEYLPFGAGRRMCPGVGFGVANVELTLAQLLLYFDWRLPDGMKPEDIDMSESFGLNVSRKTELKLLATPKIPLP